jgi:hypothetical protein
MRIVKLPIKNLPESMDPVHFYCVQVYTDSSSMHFHAPLPQLLSAIDCHKMADHIRETGDGRWGDDPNIIVAFSFNPTKIVGVMVEHKVSYTRAELIEMQNQPPSDGNPISDLMRRMGSMGGGGSHGGMN